MASSSTHSAISSAHPGDGCYLGLTNAFHWRCLRRYEALLNHAPAQSDLQTVTQSERNMLHEHWPLSSLDHAMYQHGESLNRLLHGEPINTPHVVKAESHSDQAPYQAPYQGPHQGDPSVHPAKGYHELYNFLLAESQRRHLDRSHPFFASHPDASHEAPALPRRPLASEGDQTLYSGLSLAWHAELLRAMTRCAGHTTLAWIQHYDHDLFQAILQAQASTPELKDPTAFLEHLQQMYRALHGKLALRPDLTLSSRISFRCVQIS